MAKELKKLAADFILDISGEFQESAEYDSSLGVSFSYYMEEDLEDFLRRVGEIIKSPILTEAFKKIPTIKEEEVVTTKWVIKK